MDSKLHIRAAVLPLFLAIALAGCGGGGGGATTNTASTGTGQTSGGTATTGTVKLSWNAPVKNANGQPIAPSDLGGYKIYYGASQTSLDHVINVPDGQTTDYSVGDLSTGSYYFAISAYDSYGSEGPRTTPVRIDLSS